MGDAWGRSAWRAPPRKFGVDVLEKVPADIDHELGAGFVKQLSVRVSDARLVPDR